MSWSIHPSVANDRNNRHLQIGSNLIHLLWRNFLGLLNRCPDFLHPRLAPQLCPDALQQTFHFGDRGRRIFLRLFLRQFTGTRFEKLLEGQISNSHLCLSQDLACSQHHPTLAWLSIFLSSSLSSRNTDRGLTSSNISTMRLIWAGVKFGLPVNVSNLTLMM